MNGNLKNTQEWLNEYVYGVDARNIPDFPFSQTDSLKAKNLILLGGKTVSLAVVLGLKRNANILMVPLSQYTKPANNLEVTLPNSGLIACTWNSRIFKQSEIAEIESIGIISDEDFDILKAHYLAFSQMRSCEAHISKLTGASFSKLKEEEQNLISEYMYEEYLQLPEDIFTSISPKLDDIFQESLEIEFDEEEFEDEEENIINFPGFNIQSTSFTTRLAASKKNDNNKDDKE